MSAVTREWMHTLPWKMQTVPLSALRGCEEAHQLDERLRDAS